MGLPGSSAVKNPPASARATEGAGSIPVLQTSQARGNGNPRQHTCLGNPRRREVYRVAKSRTRLSEWAHTHICVCPAICMLSYLSILYLWIQLFTAIKLSVYLLISGYVLSLYPVVYRSIYKYMFISTHHLSLYVYLYMSCIYDIYMSYILYIYIYIHTHTHTHTHIYINLKRNQPWILIRSTDDKAETPVFGASDRNSQLIWKVRDAEKDWGQKAKRVSEDEMAGWDHWCNRQELGQTSGDGERQRGLVCCSPQGHRVGNTWETE